MMTSPDSTAQQFDGRTVREIVEHNHEMVSESWCRRIVRQVLQSLDVQYGMCMPHRLITPDTLLILDSGDPMLLPSSDQEPDPEAARATEARDLHDLAAVVHYAITLDLGPATPLAERAPPEYSAAFIHAIDLCLLPDPAARPQTIEQMRDLLGIVAHRPPAPLPPLHEDPAPFGAPPAPVAPATPSAAAVSAAAATVSAPPIVERARAEPKPARAAAPAPDLPNLLLTRSAPPPAAAPAAPARRPRWWLVAGIALIVAALAALFALLRPADGVDAPVVATPAADGMAPADALAEPQAEAPAPLVTLPAAPPPRLEGPVIDETAAGAPVAPPAAPDAVVPPTAVQLAPQGAPPEAIVAGTTYTLAIRPWGTIVVDGVERGASPPLKRLTLPPGEHTIRIVNPNFPEHSVTVQSAQDQSGTIELDFTEEETP